MHGRGMTQGRLAELTGINRSVLCRILANEPGRGKESRAKLFPHLTFLEIKILGWRAEFKKWLVGRSTGNIVPSGLEEWFASH